MKLKIYFLAILLLLLSCSDEEEDSPDYNLDKIIGAGFDGVYLDIIEGFEYFE